MNLEPNPDEGDEGISKVIQRKHNEKVMDAEEGPEKRSKIVSKKESDRFKFVPWEKMAC